MILVAGATGEVGTGHHTVARTRQLAAPTVLLRRRRHTRLVQTASNVAWPTRFDGTRVNMHGVIFAGLCKRMAEAAEHEATNEPPPQHGERRDISSRLIAISRATARITLDTMPQTAQALA